MDVLHLSAGNLFGGVERILIACAAFRREAPEMRPAFGVFFDGRLATELDRTGVTCERYGDVRVSRPHTVLRARRRLGERLQDGRPDVAVCHSSWTFGLAAPVLRRAGVPAAIWLHDRVSGRPWAERWAAMSEPALVICNSRYTATSAPAVFPAAQARVVYAPVAPAARRETRGAVRASLGATDDQPVVLIASRFERWKGHLELVEALASIQGPWQLWIAGAPQRDGERELERQVAGRVNALGLHERVRFLGHRDDVPALMGAADLLAQPNTEGEPFGIVFVEALYAGLPVVTTATGGALEIVTGDCGRLVPAGDPGALRDALARLLADADERARLSRGGPSRARDLCDPRQRLSDLAGLLEPAVRSHQRSVS